MHREWVHLKAGNFIVACVTVDQLSSHYIVAHGPVAPTSTSTQVHKYMHNNQLTSKCSYSSTLNLEKSRNPCSKAYSSTGAFYTLATIDREADNIINAHMVWTKYAAIDVYSEYEEASTAIDVYSEYEEASTAIDVYSEYEGASTAIDVYSEYEGAIDGELHVYNTLLQ